MKDPFHLIHFDPEATPDEGAGFTPEPEATPTPEPEPAAAEWQGPSKEEWEQSQQFIQQAAPILSQIAQAMQQPPAQQTQQPQAQEPEVTFDPFDPTSVQSYIDKQAEAKAKELLSPYEPVLGIVASQHGEQYARTELDRLKGEIGEFDPDAALMLAAGMLDQDVPPEQALINAAQYVHEWEEKIRKAEAERLGQSLQEHHAAPAEAPAAGASATPTPKVPTGPDRYEKVVSNWLASRRAGVPVG